MGSGTNKKLALAAMIFAVAMTFIDQTIVAIAVPDLQKDLGLSEAGVQWVINGYLCRLVGAVRVRRPDRRHRRAPADGR